MGMAQKENTKDMGSSLEKPSTQNTGKALTTMSNEESSNTSDFQQYLPLSPGAYHLIQGATQGMSDSPQFLENLLSHAGTEEQSDHDYGSNPLQFLGNNHNLPGQSPRPPPQGESGYYPHGSPSNEPQFPSSSFNQMNIYHHAATVSSAGLSSPGHVQPSSPVRSPALKSEGRVPRFTFTHTQSMSPYSNMNGACPASVSMDPLPDTTNFPGSHGFQLSFGPPTDGATKSIDYTYSHKLKKLYVQRGAHCPFKFKSQKRPPPGSYVKILPVFKGTHVLSEPVKRCSNHAESEEEGDYHGQPRYHFIRSNNRLVRYDASESGRLFLTVPYTGPQVGAEYQTELLSFMCFNSCGNSSHAKRRIDVIFTLEHNQEVLGRQVIEVRVCACPGRDRTNEESLGGTRKRRGSSTNPRTIKRRRNSQETFTVTTSNEHVYTILLSVQNLLEGGVAENYNGIQSPTSSCASTPSPNGRSDEE